MIDAQLGPPPAVASRGGSAPTGGPADVAPEAHAEADGGSFGAALRSRTTPPSSDAHRTAEAHTDKDAAGPRKGELQDGDAADAGAPKEQTGAAGTAAAIASAACAVTPAAASPTPPSGALAAAQEAAAVQAAPPPPLAGLVPAALDGKGGVVPAGTAGRLPSQAATAVAVTAGVAPAAPATAGATAAPAPAAASATTTATAAAAPAAATAAGPSASAAGPEAATRATMATAEASPAPAATLTLTITPTPPKDGAAGAIAGGPAAPVATAPATPPATGADAKATAVPATPAPAREPARDAATTAAPPAGAVAPAPVQQPAPPDPLGGIVRPSGGLTTPHELARELGERVHMAVREGGRELVVNLRPAELGHLTIRVTMHDGVMQASIVADRPEAARMLQQSIGHLDTALGDLGYSLGNLDVAYNGQDAQDAQSSQGTDSPVRGEVLEADGTPAVSGTTTGPARASSSRLDILA